MSKENRMETSILCLCVITYVAGLSIKVLGAQIYLFPIALLYIASLFRLNNLKRIPYDLVKIEFVLFAIMAATFISNGINSTGTTDYLIKILIMATFSWVVWTGVRDVRHYKTCFFVVILILSVSSIVAICQNLGMKWALNIWYNRFYSDSVRSPYLYQSLLGGRSAGLSSYSINLGFQLVQTIPLTAYYIYDEESKINKKLTVTLSLLLFFGTVATGTRMAVLIGIIQFILFFIDKKKISQSTVIKATGLVIGFLIAYLVWFSQWDIVQHFLLRVNSDNGSSVASRMNTVSYYIRIWGDEDMMHLLLGNGLASMNSYRTSDVLGSGHNSIVTALFEFGLVGMFLTVVLYAIIFRLLKRHHDDKFVKSLILGLSGYLLMSLTNDSLILDGDLFHIIFLSMTVAYIVHYDENMQSEVRIGGENHVRCPR